MSTLLQNTSSKLWIKQLLPLTLGGFSIGMTEFLMMGCLLTIAMVTDNKLWALIMTFITGAVAFAVVPAMQMLMIDAAKGSEMLAASMVQASANMGNTLGAYLGGLPIAAGFGYTSPEYVGMALTFIGLVLCFIIKLTRNADNFLASHTP